MELRVIGRYKGKITVDPDKATVLDLKKAVARQSGLAIPELKLLAGGKHLKDDALTLSQCGISRNKPIMVLRQDLPDRVQAEEELHRRTQGVTQAASALSALAARDIGLGTSGRDNPRGGGGQGGQNNARLGGGMGLAGVPKGAPKIELTNQHGEAMSIPAEDSAALMEGMMLHRSALACVALTRQSAAPALAKKKQFPMTAGAEEKKEKEFLNNASPLEVGTDPESGAQHGQEETKGLAPEDGGQEERKGNEDGNSAQRGDGASSGPLGKVEPTKKGKGKGKMKLAPARRIDDDRRLPPASEKRMAQREALGLLFKAEEAFRRCDPKYLEFVDNYAYLCLDIVWLLFLMKDMSNLDLASRMLVSVEKGFQKAHGPGLQRLTALKGEFCAEKLLYVRLHLLQGVMAFLQGDSGKASGLLIRAREEAKALKPDPVLAMKLIRKWRTLKMEDLRPKVALLALRTGRNDLDAAWHYLEGVRQREETSRKEMGERMAKQKRERQFGLTSDKNAFVDAALVAQLTDGGFSRGKVIRALRKHNNDIEAALAFLTAAQAREASSGSKDEALAIMQSLGVPQEAARDALERTGVLCDALQELGINAPEGMVPPQRNDGGKGAAVDGGGIDDTDVSNSGEDVVWKATEEEARLLVELAADKKDQEEGEGYLDISLEDEADAADMYLHLCRGKIPLTFDLDKVRAGIAAASEEVKHAGDGGGK